MPIAKSPLFDEVKKAFPTCDIRMRKNKKIEIAKFRYPSNPRTPAQQAQRRKYGKAVQAWRSLSQQEKEQWNAQAEPLGISGWNLFFKQYTPVEINEVYLNPIADAFVDKSAPSSNYGTLNQLRLDGHATYTWRSLLKFDLSSIPSNATVLQSTLSLYYYQYKANNPAGYQANLHRITADWAENTVNWNNQPAHDSTIEAYTTFPSSYGWMVWDIANLVQKWINGTYTNYGMKLKMNNENDADRSCYFYSRENPTNKPTLYIKYQAPA